MNTESKTYTELETEAEELRRQLFEANETLEAIRTGQVDALVVEKEDGHRIYSLRSADQAYRVFIEQMTEGAVTMNGEGIIVYSNTSFANMVSLPLSAVVGLPFGLFVAPADKPVYESVFRQCWQEGCKTEINLLAAGTAIPVQLSFTVLELESGPSLSLIVTDLTEQKRIQRQLSKSNEELALANKALETSNHDLQQFASIASHDLQEPLRKIQMFARLLSNGHDAGKSDGYLAKVIASAGRMRSLIVDILTYSRLSSNETSLSPVDLNKIVADLREDFELLIAEKAAVIETEKLPVIEANAIQMRQVFQNLLSNALKFSREEKPPVVRITGKRIAAKSFAAPDDDGGGFCLISVKDDGIGFPPEYAGKIFSLFERLNSKDKYEGTGIGLAIAKKIIEKHRGLITAKSKAGNGAEFLFILPLYQPPFSFTE